MKLFKVKEKLEKKQVPAAPKVNEAEEEAENVIIQNFLN